MLLGKPFVQFVEESPISVMMRGIVEYAFEAKRLDDLFEDTAEAQYTRTLHFSTVADLMSEVVFDISPSIGAAYQANIGEMAVSPKSVYNKLNGIEPRISAALVEDSVTQFSPVIEKLRKNAGLAGPGEGTNHLAHLPVADQGSQPHFAVARIVVDHGEFSGTVVNQRVN